MNPKRFFILFTLLIGISFILSTTALTSISAQTALQQPATPPPGRPITPRFPLPQALMDQFTGPNSGAQLAYTRYMRLTDAAEVISIEVPLEWSDVETGPWMVRGQAVGVFIAAAPDLDSFYASQAAPGVFFGASRDLVGSTQVANSALASHPAIGQVLSDEKSSRQGQCRNVGRFAYQDNFYAGSYDLGLNCTLRSRAEIALVTMPPNQQYLSLLRIRITSRADIDAATHMFDTYQVLNMQLKDDH